MDRQYALSAVLLLASLQILFAFAPIGQLQRSSVPASRVRELGLRSQLTASTRLWMAEEQDKQGEETEAADSAEVIDEVSDEAEKEEEPKEEPKEDPEIVALKEEIAQLESTLKNKKTTLSYTQDQIEEFSKGGYARKVAEMENMRRVRSVSKRKQRSFDQHTIVPLTVTETETSSIRNIMPSSITECEFLWQI
jgi:flagellar motility protein MotE (MotC chaperone)